MKVIICAVRDSATLAFMQPFFARTPAEALRSFALAANSEDHQFSRYSADYTLFQIGEFDDQSGTITPNAPVSLGVAAEFRRPETAAAAQMDIEEAIRNG